MKVIEYTPYVLKAVSEAGVITQTDLTEAVWGTSGRGNKTLTDSLFPYLIRAGLVRMDKRGRSKMFSLTLKGSEYLTQHPVQ